LEGKQARGSRLLIEAHGWKGGSGGGAGLGGVSVGAG
jgi:hypothetical protein